MVDQMFLEKQGLFINIMLDKTQCLEECSRWRNAKYQAEEISFGVRVDMDLLPANLDAYPILVKVETLKFLIESLLSLWKEGFCAQWI